MTHASYAAPELPAAWHDGPSLSDHVRACQAALGRSFAVRCVGERLHLLLSPRFFTTVFAAVALISLLAGGA
jgi:hypothetical protein